MEKVAVDRQAETSGHAQRHQSAVFSILGPSFAIKIRCPCNTENFSRFHPFSRALLGYILNIGVNTSVTNGFCEPFWLEAALHRQRKIGNNQQGRIFSRADELTYIWVWPGARCGWIEGLFFLNS